MNKYMSCQITISIKLVLNCIMFDITQVYISIVNNKSKINIMMNITCHLSVNYRQINDIYNLKITSIHAFSFLVQSKWYPLFAGSVPPPLKAMFLNYILVTCFFNFSIVFHSSI